MINDTCISLQFQDKNHTVVYTILHSLKNNVHAHHNLLALDTILQQSTSQLKMTDNNNNNNNNNYESMKTGKHFISPGLFNMSHTKLQLLF